MNTFTNTCDARIQIKFWVERIKHINNPDKNKDNPKASEKFSAATNAYDLLSDKDKRARFDRGEIDASGQERAPRGFYDATGDWHFTLGDGAVDH